MELTVEMSQDKWPSEALLPGLFQANLPALLAFPLAAAFGGLRHASHSSTGNAWAFARPCRSRTSYTMGESSQQRALTSV